MRNDTAYNRQLLVLLAQAGVPVDDGQITQEGETTRLSLKGPKGDSVIEARWSEGSTVESVAAELAFRAKVRMR